MPAGRAAGATEHEAPPLGVCDVEQREREVARATRQARSRGRAGLIVGPRVGGARREIAEHRELALPDDPLRGLGHCAEDSSHPARLVADRTVGEREVALLREAPPVEREHEVLEVAGLPALQHVVEHGADGAPYLRPALPTRLAHRPRVLVPEDRLVGVVVEHDQLRAPPQEHREAGVQADADGGLQTLRPHLCRAERGPGPVHAAHERAHGATSPQEGQGSANGGSPFA